MTSSSRTVWWRRVCLGKHLLTEAKHVFSSWFSMVQCSDFDHRSLLILFSISTSLRPINSKCFSTISSHDEKLDVHFHWATDATPVRRLLTTWGFWLHTFRAFQNVSAILCLKCFTSTFLCNTSKQFKQEISDMRQIEFYFQTSIVFNIPYSKSTLSLQQHAALFA